MDEFHSFLDRKLRAVLLSLGSGPVTTSTVQIAAVHNIDAANKRAFALLCLPDQIAHNNGNQQGLC
jgi:hypothetical protein